jgi:hypothetical protein
MTATEMQQPSPECDFPEVEHPGFPCQHFTGEPSAEEAHAHQAREQYVHELLASTLDAYDKGIITARELAIEIVKIEGDTPPASMFVGW